jgi:hypothetical protein
MVELFETPLASADVISSLGERRPPVKGLHEIHSLAHSILIVG